MPSVSQTIVKQVEVVTFETWGERMSPPLRETDLLNGDMWQ